MSPQTEHERLRADTDSLRRMNTRREVIIAGTGGLPTTDELRRGVPFLRGSMIEDLQAFIATELLEAGHSPKTLKALRLAMDNPTAATLRAASDAMGTGNGTDPVRRLDLYAAWLGDKLGRDRTVRRGFEELWIQDVSTSGMALAVAFGLSGYSPYRPGAGGINTQTVDDTVDNGVGILLRIGALADRIAPALELAKAPTAEDDRIDQVMSAIAAIEEDRSEIEDLHVDDGIPEAYLGTPPGPAQDLVVVPALDAASGNSHVRDIRKSWIGIAGERLPLVQVSDLAGAAKGLVERWPHAKWVIHTIMTDLAHGGPVRFRPTCLVGTPGSGKTALLREIARVVGLECEAYNMGGQADASVMGTSAQWSTTRESAILQMIKRSRKGNVAFVWDEVEKAGTSKHNGSALDAMLPMLERDQARRYRDLCLEVEVDLSMVSHFATANSLEGIPSPLKDRMRILRMPEPDWQALGTLVGHIIETIAVERGVDRRWYAPLAEDEMDIVRAVWPGGSLRRLRRTIETLLDGRDMILGRA